MCAIYQDLSMDDCPYPCQFDSQMSIGWTTSLVRSPWPRVQTTRPTELSRWRSTWFFVEVWDRNRRMWPITGFCNVENCKTWSIRNSPMDSHLAFDVTKNRMWHALVLLAVCLEQVSWVAGVEEDWVICFACSSRFIKWEVSLGW